MTRGRRTARFGRAQLHVSAAVAAFRRLPPGRPGRSAAAFARSLTRSGWDLYSFLAMFRNYLIVSSSAKTRESLEKTLPYFNRLVPRVRKVRSTGSAALALAYVATGRFDAYIERGISLWDIAAGGLIVECAGGEFWRKPIAGMHKFRMIASNGLIHNKLPRPN